MRNVLNGVAVVLLHTVLLLGVAITILPFAWMVLSSFKTTTEVFRYPPALLPDKWLTLNYRRLFTEVLFPLWYRNSILVSGTQTLAVLFFASLAGFGFGKYEFKGREVLFAIVIASMIIPFHAIVIPMFVVVSRMGLLDKYVTLVLPWMAPA